MRRHQAFAVAPVGQAQLKGEVMICPAWLAAHAAGPEMSSPGMARFSLHLGPARSCVPRHAMELNSTHEASKCDG